MEACPIDLAGTLGDNNIITLTWAPYGGWKNGVDHYLVEKFNEQGQLLQTFNMGIATILVDDEVDFDNQTYVYRVTAVAKDAGVSVSNTITIIKEPNLAYPTAFTPNGDGNNDLFKVFGQFTSEVEFKIFNRWGELLFITYDLDQGWDGTYKGSAMPEGTYVFRAYLTDLAGRTSERSGTVVLLRKK
jgi:gliding motility-associated-like protein